VGSTVPGFSEYRAGLSVWITCHLQRIQVGQVAQLVSLPLLHRMKPTNNKAGNVCITYSDCEFVALGT